MKRAAVVILFIALLAWVLPATAAEGKDDFIVLCYHDMPKEVKLDIYAVDQKSFVQQIEYLTTHGYHFISVNDVIEASEGKKTLPEKAVLLTFDDGYLSYYEFVYPLLELYGYPSLLAVETGWVDKPDPELTAPLVNWDQLKEMSKSKLVYIASHSNDIHHEVLYNPQGNTSWAAISRIYNPDTGAYESKGDYRKRIHDDLALSKKILKQKLEVDTEAMVWPYGKYNQICVEEAKALGFKLMFYLDDKMAGSDKPYAIPRYMFVDNPKMQDFIKELNADFNKPVKQRVLHTDLDLIYDPDPVKQEKNLDKFIERVFGMKVSTVYLQAFCDKDGDGSISSVYFPNRVLPMRADLFNRVVNQLSIRDIQVYAWMPMLSIALPDKEETDALRIRQFKKGKIELSTSWYPRLSPFSKEARQKLVMLYEDMAVSSKIDGVFFLDDGYLNDFEDFHPDAQKEYAKITGGEIIPYDKLSPEQKEEWTKLKTGKLIELTDEFKKAVLYYRPQALFARTLYAEVLTDPDSEEWYAQNYAESLKAYDYVVLMAYPKMEEESHSISWLNELVQDAEEYPDGIKKTVFKVQAYDWEREKWIAPKTVSSWLKRLVASGAWNVGYYPDSYILNKPDQDIIRTIMSKEDFSFKRKYSPKDIILTK
ncbi:MAG: poly-beta-1,6-N-acetyl-D-glucosamine N-deacetylase PgaB [Candidatus Omnitrophica bacterium]|nr:poly-beta-1,6-N-acetyl-D-glucosamine N-deacetylase PgaB [Candidatus Omnitrophota bacterium]MBU1933367.1 poly-beta-1,6-N-acetyl-D-glucosamine N-deacetylase PgaB [Candidatus Omnitrophota bacterium]